MMQSIGELSLGHGLLSLLVAARIAGLVIALPSVLTMLSWRIRIALILTITAIVVPGLQAIELDSDQSLSQLIVDAMITTGREFVLGMIIGGVVQLLVSGVQLAGELITSVAGLPLNNGATESTPALSRLIGLLVTAVLFACGGHRYLMAALMDSFHGIAPGSVTLDASLVDLIIEQLTTGMSAGLRVAAPVLAATLMTQLLVGLVSRTMPQINVLAVGLNLNVLVMLVVTAITIGTAGLVFQHELATATEQLHTMW